MEKTEAMKKYERLIGMNVNWDANPTGYQKWLESEVLLLKEHSENLEFLLNIQNKEISTMKAKAAAYDRLMSGGKKTLKEWANLTGLPFAINKFGTGCAFDAPPEFYDGDWHGFAFLAVDMRFIDYTGSFQDSLTFPDGWETKGENK